MQSCQRSSIKNRDIVLIPKMKTKGIAMKNTSKNQNEKEMLQAAKAALVIRLCRLAVACITCFALFQNPPI